MYISLQNFELDVGRRDLGNRNWNVPNTHLSGTYGIPPSQLLRYSKSSGKSKNLKFQVSYLEY